LEFDINYSVRVLDKGSSGAASGVYDSDLNGDGLDSGEYEWDSVIDFNNSGFSFSGEESHGYCIFLSDIIGESDTDNVFSRSEKRSFGDCQKERVLGIGK
jgi:hypothetical protein